MLTHRKNWCRVCGICLTCPRTSKSVFQQGSCHCIEKQANHVNPSKVKGEMLFSFRYRHLSAEDIDILEELRPRFRFITPPIERNLVRANICSTCQQRLRRARISRRRKNLAPAKLNIVISAKNSSASSSEEDEGEGAFTMGLSRQQELPFVARPHSAIRSTLPSVSQAATWLVHAQLRTQQQPQHTLKPTAAEAVDLHDPASRLFIDEPDSQLNAAAPLAAVPVHPHRISHSPIGSRKPRSYSPNFLAPNASDRQRCTPPSMSAFCEKNSPEKDSTECSDDEMDETRVELDEENCVAQSKCVKLPPILYPLQPRSPLPLLPPPHTILPANWTRQTIKDQEFLSMEPNIEFRDASNAVLFREAISGDYPLEDIFSQYYPESPRSLLFYIQNGMALPKKSTLNSILNQYSFQHMPVVVWAKVPVAANPNHTPQW